MPPEAQDVPSLMKGLVEWINKNQLHIPNPILAAVAHYQFATIHPYLDGNGRTARLLATYIVHKGGYDLKGIYCLDEYYAKDIQAYYNALTIGPSHNYYMGRETADITRWIEYFCVGMAEAFERVHMRAEQAAESGVPAQSMLLREVDDRQRKALCLLEEYSVVTTIQLADLFGIAERTARAWCTQWVKQGFLRVADPSRRARKYILAPQFLPLISK